MRAAAVGLLLVLVLVAQTSLLAPFAIWGVRPNLTLVVVYAAGLRYGMSFGALLGLLAGLILDVVAGRMVGLSGVSSAVAGFAAGWIGERLLRGNPLIPVAVAFASSMLGGATYLLAARAFGMDFPIIDSVSRTILPGAWYDALAMAMLYPLITRLFRHLDVRVEDRSAKGVEG